MEYNPEPNVRPGSYVGVIPLSDFSIQTNCDRKAPLSSPGDIQVILLRFLCASHKLTAPIRNTKTERSRHLLPQRQPTATFSRSTSQCCFQHFEACMGPGILRCSAVRSGVFAVWLDGKGVTFTPAVCDPKCWLGLGMNIWTRKKAKERPRRSRMEKIQRRRLLDQQLEVIEGPKQLKILILKRWYTDHPFRKTHVQIWTVSRW